jgi:hypothetical protein
MLYCERRFEDEQNKRNKLQEKYINKMVEYLLILRVAAKIKKNSCIILIESNKRPF